MRRFLLTAIFLLAAATTSFAQGTRDLVINEILVKNTNNFEDNYGHRVSWIELFNNGYSQVNVSSCFLNISSGDETISYRIPKNDSRTIISPQGYIVFFCEGTQTKGTFHTNFTLSMGDDKSVITSDTFSITSPDKIIALSLLEANGRDTISSVTYNLADQKADVAMGRIKTDDDTYIFAELESTTPYATNETKETLPPHEEFRRTDPVGYGMALTAMSVVFAALFALYMVFRTVGKTMVRIAKKKKEKEGANNQVAVASGSETEVFSGDVMAAIAMALHMYENDLHDNEHTVLTINRVAKAYSPWSSKLYGLTQMPNRK